LCLRGGKEKRGESKWENEKKTSWGNFIQGTRFLFVLLKRNQVRNFNGVCFLFIGKRRRQWLTTDHHMIHVYFQLNAKEQTNCVILHTTLYHKWQAFLFLKSGFVLFVCLFLFFLFVPILFMVAITIMCLGRLVLLSSSFLEMWNDEVLASFRVWDLFRAPFFYKFIFNLFRNNFKPLKKPIEKWCSE
jgi:hypothetical protein